MKKDISLYVHIPFCGVKCRYCDFLSFDGESYGTMLRYVDSLCQEIKLYSPVASNYIVRTIFIGGGTPSILHEGLIENILAFIRMYFNVYKEAEITIECNPGTVRHHKLSEYKRIGINRISIGLQSTNDEHLRLMGRLHNFDQFIASYNAVRRAGFNNVNIDIMSGLPNQNLRSYADTINRVLQFGPEHISAYSLSIEEGTPFASDYEVLQNLPSEDEDRKMYEITKTLLKGNGYERYEFSNYAKPGFECKHNIVYWTGGEYIGFGIGAASYFQGSRFSNLKDLKEYISIMENVTDQFIQRDNMEILYNEVTRKIRQDVIPMYIDSRMEEFMFLGLRMTKGIKRSEFEARFKKDIYEVYGPIINKYINDGFIEFDGEVLRLNDKGIDVSNIILSDFLLTS